MKPSISEREVLRALRRLSAKGARLVADGKGGLRFEASSVAGDAGVIGALDARGFLAPDSGGGFTLNGVGKAALRRALAEVDGFAAQHQDRGVEFIADEEGTRPVLVNHDESPLAWLRRRRGRDGRPLVDAKEFAAGERLRADYARGHIMPRVTANWTAAVAGRGRASSGSVAELTEVAMAARQRVERALTAVGPELGGLLVDFCCFLKGLEEIERERGWPARSAKVTLRIALAVLARHYGLTRIATGKARSGGPLHWGTEDYRPTID